MSSEKKSKTDQAYDQILEFLLKGNFQPGDRIPTENEIKDMFGVSRNTVRTVLNRLNILGFVETQRGKGTYIRSVSPDLYLHHFVPAFLVDSNDLIDLLQFRRGVEITSARLAAMNATDEDIRSLENYFEVLLSGKINNHDYATMTSDFHHKIAIASKNKILMRLLELIKWTLTSNMENFLDYTSNVADSSFYHYMVFKCIQQRKAEEAAYMMDRHMSLLLEHVRIYLNETKSKT